MSAGVAGTTSFRPNPSYTTLRDVTRPGPNAANVGVEALQQVEVVGHRAIVATGGARLPAAASARQITR
jgi:hypothetical protein